MRTVQGWEKKEALPVHRHLHNTQSSVYAYPEELPAWWHKRGAQLPEDLVGTAAAKAQVLDSCCLPRRILLAVKVLRTLFFAVLRLDGQAGCCQSPIFPADLLPQAGVSFPIVSGTPEGACLAAIRVSHQEFLVRTASKDVAKLLGELSSGNRNG